MADRPCMKLGINASAIYQNLWINHLGNHHNYLFFKAAKTGHHKWYHQDIFFVDDAQQKKVEPL